MSATSAVSIATSLPIADLVRGVLEPSSQAGVIVWALRLPRVALAFLVGGALGVSGAALQALIRNPLAEPYLLGVSGGAGLGAVAAIALGLTGMAAIPLAAFGLLNPIVAGAATQGQGFVWITSRAANLGNSPADSPEKVLAMIDDVQKAIPGEPQTLSLKRKWNNSPEFRADTANLVRALHAAGREGPAGDLEYEAESVDDSPEMTAALKQAKAAGRADRS